MFQSLGGHASARRMSHEPCFCQADCFVQGPFAFLPCAPKSHLHPLPHLGPSDILMFLITWGSLLCMYLFCLRLYGRVLLACLFYIVFLDVTMASWLGFWKVGRFWKSGSVCCFLCCLCVWVLFSCVCVCLFGWFGCEGNLPASKLVFVVVVYLCMFRLCVISC